MAGKLNTWTLGGLMVGPILGSGIVLLPPLAFARLGSQAIWAWLVVLVLGAAFAAVFIRMTLRARSDAGIASLVAKEWGPIWGELASNYLTGAVIFGAVPVFLTAARLWPAAWSLGLPPNAWAALFLVVTVALLLAGLTTVSRLTLTLSTLTALALVVGGSLGLSHATVIWPEPVWDNPQLGPTLLLLFWAIVGWEVVANYSGDVRNPEKTVLRAGLVSLIAVSLVYLVTTLSLQSLGSGPPTMATVLKPLFGPVADEVAGLLAAGLCLGTVLMFVGAVTRMTDQRARLGTLPRWLMQKREKQTPRRAIVAIGVTSSLILVGVQYDVLTLENLVAIANLFFLGNALLGLAAAWKILTGWLWKSIIVVLAVVLGLLVLQGHVVGWILLGLVTAATMIWRGSKSRTP